MDEPNRDEPNRDERTSGRGYPLPHPDNTLSQDVARLRAAIADIDADTMKQIAETRRQRVRHFLGLKL